MLASLYKARADTERAPQKHIGLYGAINDSIGQNTDIEKIYE